MGASISKHLSVAAGMIVCLPVASALAWSGLPPTISDVTATPYAVQVAGSDVTTIDCRFSSTDTNGFSVTLVADYIPGPEDVTLCSDVTDLGPCGGAGNASLRIVNEGGSTTVWHATMQWDPPDGTLLGQYDLICAVRDSAGGMTAVVPDGFPELELSDCPVWCNDGDLDGFGDPTLPYLNCGGPGPPVGYVGDCTDCNDAEITAYPGGSEIAADGIDQDCDGGDACYSDGDGDGFGTTNMAYDNDLDCGNNSQAGTAVLTGDCDDAAADIFPGAAPNDSVSACMKDSDADDYGDAAPPGTVSPGSDCDDSTPAIPATEICDGLDNDCVGGTDDGPLWVDKGSPCAIGLGECRSYGSFVCNALDPSGSTVCDATVIVPPSTPDDDCDGADDDCNGEADEDLVPDDTCGTGFCRINNYPSHCDGGGGAGVVACQAAQPLDTEDTTCDGVDDDCDGTADDEANTLCAVSASPCFVGACTGNGCASTRISGCCVLPSDCPSASACVQGDCQAAACVYANPTNCCTSGGDCDDANACTDDGCDESTGQCVARPIAYCCNTNADCNDDDLCTKDACTGDRRCRHEWQCTDTPCGVATSCVSSGLYLAKGADPDEPVQVGADDRVVLPLSLSSEALAMTVNALVLTVEIVPPARQPLRLSVYVDANDDGRIDPGSQPRVDIGVEHGGGTAALAPMQIGISPASRVSLLVTARLAGSGQAGWLDTALPPVAAACLAGLAILLLRRRRFISAAAAVLVAAMACSYQPARLGALGRLTLERNEDVVGGSPAGEVVLVSGAPLDSVFFSLP